jgi:hypothetical protein
VNALARAVLLVAPLIASAGCAKLHARTAPPPLEAPLPPPRVIVPVESEPVVPVVEAPGRRPPRDAPRAAPPPKPEKTEPPSVPTTNQPSDDPARVLQTTANASGVEQKIRALLASAAHDLGRIDYRTLSVDAQTQYDIARRFKEQAEEALNARNLVFAEQLADKAAALAGQLLKR